jgi:hypothetical protein
MGLFLHLGIMLSGYRSNPPFIYSCYLVGGLEHVFYFSIPLRSMSMIFAIMAMYAPPDYAAHVSEF